MNSLSKDDDRLFRSITGLISMPRIMSQILKHHPIWTALKRAKVSNLVMALENKLHTFCTSNRSLVGRWVTVWNISWMGEVV